MAAEAEVAPEQATTQRSSDLDERKRERYEAGCLCYPLASPLTPLETHTAEKRERREDRREGKRYTVANLNGLKLMMVILIDSDNLIDFLNFIGDLIDLFKFD
ncbi:uncharacterized protein G2W53_012393 [Senna tora]|uniref:Uncharacterized protein n=1 Tax=Senna tora TaxID=362788 RepID=A0A834WNI9_9FABA|nr:uncharacterized protein G2W53_012393 [Senna tora]